MIYIVPDSNFLHISFDKSRTITYSMIDYARKNKGSYYFVSKDRIFSGKVKSGSADRLQQEFVRSWYEYPMEKYPDEEDMLYEGSFIVEVTYNTQNRISVHFHTYQYVGGAHGGSVIFAYTYDLKKGKQLSLKEVLNMEEASILKLVNQCIDNDIKSSEGGKYYEEKADIKDI